MTALPNYAGIREYHRSRQTGTMIGVYDGIAAEMDVEAGRWQTVCEEHGTILSHATRRIASDHSRVPLEWCEECRGDD